MYFISDIKKMLSSRIVQITFIFLLVTMLADPISVLIHARRYTGFFENIGANPFQFWLLMNSASWGNKVYNILFWVIPVLATGMIYYNEQSSSMSKFLVVRKSKLRVADGLFCREIDGLFCRSSPDIIVRRRCVLSHKRRGWLEPSPSFRYSRNLALQDELYHPVINNGPAVLVCVDKRLGTGPVNQSRDAG